MIYVVIGMIVIILVQMYQNIRLQIDFKKERESSVKQERRWNDYVDELRVSQIMHDQNLFNLFDVERQRLLDRIQAPSYDVMKHHEVKIIKAKNNEKEPEKLEVM